MDTYFELSNVDIRSKFLLCVETNKMLLMVSELQSGSHQPQTSTLQDNITKLFNSFMRVASRTCQFQLHIHLTWIVT